MKTNTAPKVTLMTHEGAPAKRIAAEQQLRRSVMACLLWENEFYEDGQSIAERIHDAASKCSPEFVSQVAIEARTEHGLRHAPLWLTLDLIRRGGKWAGYTITKVIRRADELTELVAMYWKANPGKPLSAQMKLGLAAAFTKFNAHELAKYDRANAVRLRDVLFLTHAKPKDDIQAAIWKDLVGGKLAAPDTWEVALSGGADKKETFTRLLAERKLGYLALIRNLRNMHDAGVDPALVNAAIVARKGADQVFPFRFFTAAKEAPAFESALDAAMVAGFAQLPKLAGRTIIILDVSGSMFAPLSRASVMTRLDAGAALCAVIRGQCDDPVIYATAGSDAARKHATKLIPARQGCALRDTLKAAYRELGGGGIFLKPMLEHVRAETPTADRIVVITDEQDCAIEAKDSPILASPFGDKANYLMNVASARNGVGYGAWTHIDGFSAQCVKYIQQMEAQ